MREVPAHIDITAGIARGKPRVAGHRITVQDVVVWHELLGQTADEIGNQHGLSLAEIYAALSYYDDHREDIDQSIRSDENCIERLRMGARSKLREKLGGA